MKRSEGYITVYLALTLGILISFITTMLYGIRVHTIRYEAECAMDMGLDSIFAEYHREMLKRYGLLFIDSSYGSNVVNDSNTKAHLLHYMNMNFDHKGQGLFCKDLTELNADNAKLAGITYASDNSGEVLRYQIEQFMKTKYGVGMIDDIFNDTIDMNDLLNDYDDYAAQREEAEEKVQEIIDEINSGLGPDDEPFAISNPADSVEKLSDSNALFYALGNKKNLNMNGINLSSYISKRKFANGAGLRSSQGRADGITSKAITTKYIFDYLGFYGNERDESALNYQIEYLICGEDSDLKNLQKIASDIFKTRYAINMIYLLGDEAKKSEAEIVATVACCLLFVPELIEYVKYTILFAWGYAESAKDLRILFDGHCLPLSKNASNWNTPLSQLIFFRANLGNYSHTGGELDYEGYLKAFLFIKNLNEITLRLMDVMEMDMRITPGNSSFRMDAQIYQLTAEVNLSSSYGYGCNIRRFYTYE